MTTFFLAKNNLLTHHLPRKQMKNKMQPTVFSVYLINVYLHEQVGGVLSKTTQSYTCSSPMHVMVEQAVIPADSDRNKYTRLAIQHCPDPPKKFDSLFYLLTADLAVYKGSMVYSTAHLFMTSSIQQIFSVNLIYAIRYSKLWAYRWYNEVAVLTMLAF